jgi:hypothetical protein
MNPELPDAGQCHRARSAVLTDPNHRWPSLAVPVAQPKRVDTSGLLLEPREPDPPALALTPALIRARRQPSTRVDRGRLEYLPINPTPPRQASHHYLGCAPYIDAEHPDSVLGGFYPLNALIRSSPLHGTSTAGSNLGSVSAVHHLQALVKREPRRTGTPGQHIALLDR